ncbi:hypothetical protein BCR44DRAFT_1499895 [Catenaria anguillulae PL171]|uniref:Arp2/3 complex 34 kDa subunit n=1 Tax=Catenaria anguillulae PL171 TaxID=765915 RepID=A0A1Y2HNT7_9FUNG|nr:hypothetical protein BCR44DRAFT_1499895 [Catenaria anguillulae PL171]
MLLLDNHHQILLDTLEQRSPAITLILSPCALPTLTAPRTSDLARYGARDVLAKTFADLLLPQDQVEQGYDVTLPPRMAAPFHAAFAAQASKAASDVFAIHFREGEAIYIQAMPDRVTAIFATQFKDETDRIFAKVFLQEFADARRQPSCMNAPAVFPIPQHFNDEATREATISRIHLFRDYLHYHIKCSKATCTAV